MAEDPFSESFRFEIPLATDGNRAYFGTNVLQGLIDGIEDFVGERQPRWERRSHRTGAPAMVACSPWVTDDALLATIEKLPSACVVVSKWPKRRPESDAFARLRELNETTRGIELRALSGLGHMAPKIAGRPLVIGPYDTVDPDLTLPTFRTIGYRKLKGDVPIAHAKLALLGNICWTDEDPVGGVTEYVWFSPKRLWVSSANFTYSSRRSLEHGFWTEDAELMGGVHRFLVNLIGASEDLDAPADAPNPDLAEVEYDDVAMAQAAAESDHAREETRAIEADENGEEFDEEDW